MERSRHEGKDGIEAVGSTILNRKKLNRSDLGGNTVQGVIEKLDRHGNYHYRAMSKKDTPLPKGTEKTIAEIKICEDTADAVIAGTL